MRKFLLVLFLYALAAAPAAAYAPSGNSTYTQLETQLIKMAEACRKHQEPWRQLDCFSFVDKVRGSTYEERLSPGYQEFLNATRALLHFYPPGRNKQKGPASLPGLFIFQIFIF